MKPSSLCWLWVSVFAVTSLGGQETQNIRKLEVHVVQANNASPYTFVRAKFSPGELHDPWSVRLLDEKGADVPYFVWDYTTWGVAREGRADWGHRYALQNHGPGDSAPAREARSRKLEGAKRGLPDLGAKLQAQEAASKAHPDSVCAALYLLRHQVSAFGKERLSLRISPQRQITPISRTWKSEKVEQRIPVKEGALEFRDLPDRLSVAWNGKEFFRYAGYHAGDSRGSTSHADALRPFEVETTQGIITKVSLRSETPGREKGSMNWQCTYWLFPEGSYVALEGYSLSEPGGYQGGPQKMSLWEANGKFASRHTPLWEAPWWLAEVGEAGFVATHLFHATPLAIGFGNNPFAVNSEAQDKEPRVEIDGEHLSLSWTHRLDDPAITRLMAPEPIRRPGDPPPPPPQDRPAWQAGDWLYRQYVAGLGNDAEKAEGSLRAVLGAATGWIDRPFGEEEVARRLVDTMPRIATGPETAEIGLLKVVPTVLRNDPAATREALARARDPVARTDYYINLIRRHVERGGKASEGRKKDDPDGTPREGWTGNPCYHAALMPCYTRVLEHFDLPFPREKYQEAILRYADFTLELLGGSPIDFEALNRVFQSEWPSRIVPVLPLMLHAYTIKPEEKYARAAKLLFQDLFRLVERNPHGYFPTWTWTPKADKYDTVYNPVSYERGITSLWSEGLLELVGRAEASRFVAAQARWFIYSGQLLDTLEMDNLTAIRASSHGAHTNLRNQIGIYLFDDFEFYRGLLGELVDWSAASSLVPGPRDPRGTDPYRGLELSNAGSSMLRWALGIRPGGKWLESKREQLPEGGFRLRAWNRLPLSKPTVKVSAKEAGLKSDGDLLEVQLDGPAFRTPVEIRMTWTDDKILLNVSAATQIRVDPHVLFPASPLAERWVVVQRDSGGALGPTEGVVLENGSARWRATPGDYEIKRATR
jgi:hypothetical protein